jgi:7,8-dihydroneopterin aldolase/epimerase/oxygenase
VADRLALRGLRSFGRHGVLDHERQVGQTFIVDLVLGLDTRRAAISDDLADTVDYDALAATVAGIVAGEPVKLLETLAARIADACLVQPRVEEVEVTVHKPDAPIGVPFDDVTVTIVRSRRG